MGQGQRAAHMTVPGQKVAKSQLRLSGQAGFAVGGSSLQNFIFILGTFKAESDMITTSPVLQYFLEQQSDELLSCLGTKSGSYRILHNMLHLLWESTECRTPKLSVRIARLDAHTHTQSFE